MLDMTRNKILQNMNLFTNEMKPCYLNKLFNKESLFYPYKE